MPDQFDSEIVIGLVSAVGTENNRVIALLKERLGLAGYTVHDIKLSKDVIPLLCPVPEPGRCDYTRVTNLMDAGNKARADCGNDSVLALGAASAIYAKRAKEEAANPKAYIIDSLKRPEEVSQLRSIYPSGFVLVGIHEDEARRKKHLTAVRGMAEEHANNLIRRDGEESKVPHGQRVNKTFHMADFFVRIPADQDQLRGDVNRMVELWFGNPFITPTFDEHAMFLAFAAALRSADMSRQVGAVVTLNSQILSTGANDCPKAGGGLYWPVRMPDSRCIDDHPTGRDFRREDGDSNRAEQLRMIERIVQEGSKPEYDLDGVKLRQLLDKGPLRDLTEFGRVVHAEMEALLCCSRNGLSTVGTTLYCTTFPCHNCAKHIVAAGVSRVVYVEPYPKSKALQFHDDSIIPSGENTTDEEKRVRFDAFVGIGPRRFFDLFSMHLGSSYELIRKDENGKRVDWRIEQSQLRIQMKPTSYLEEETVASTLFNTALNRIRPNEVTDE